MAPRRAPRIALPALLGWAWLLVVLGVLSYRLGDRALIDPDEGRNVAIAQEMAVGGGVLLPRLDGLPFLDKPFLFFASVAASFRLLGYSELAARLPSLLATLATLGLTMWFSARLFGRASIWIAALAYATAPLAATFARTVIFDAPLAFFVTLASVAFYCAIEARDGERYGAGRRWLVLAWLAMALGVFTKGPIALLLPLLVALPYALLRRRLVAVLHPAGWLVHLALVVPWLVVLERKAPGFLSYALVTETWQRLTTDTMERTGPIWYFLPILLVGTMPWILVALGSGVGPLRGAIGRARERAEPLLFLWLWVCVPLVFFSLSQSKRPGYVLPLVPAIALLAARSLLDRDSSRTAIRVAASVLMLSAVPLLAVGIGLLKAGKPPSGELAPLILEAATYLGGVVVTAGLLAWLVARSSRLAGVALSLPFVLAFWVLGPVALQIGEDRSCRAAAAELDASLRPGDLLVGIEAYSGSLAFYLQRPIIVATATGAPFKANSIVAYYDELLASSAATLRPAESWRELLVVCSRPTYVLTNKKHEAVAGEMKNLGLPLLTQDRRHAVFGPCRRSPEPTVASQAGALRYPAEAAS